MDFDKVIFDKESNPNNLDIKRTFISRKYKVSKFFKLLVVYQRFQVD
jgi:hypothetical protein